jgi:hypothetical protein
MKKLLSIVLFSVALMTHGCSAGDDAPPIGKVYGKITINGQPGHDVDVMFSPSGPGRGSIGTTDKNGNYELIFNSSHKGALIGKHSVHVANHQVFDPNNPNPPMASTGLVDETISKVKKDVDVKKGSNQIDLTFP